MLKTASLTIRVKPATRSRLDALARATRRSKSFVIEEALEQYLEVNEWQVRGIAAAMTEADRPDAEFFDQTEVLKRWEAQVARKMA